MGLQITRLRVDQLRRFRSDHEWRDFEPGLNILAGPNEAGKSTLVRAIRAAFFERHRSTAVEDLRPWGEGSSAAPRVELDFTLDGQAHHLVKSFLGKKRCTLQIGGRVLDGVEAEDHLAAMFGFAFAGKGASKPEHWGIPGLLWVEQGTGQMLDVSHARDHLHTALQGQADAGVGALAASGGDEVLGQLQAQRAALLTSTGKPRAALLEAAQRCDELAAECAALDEQVTRYRQQVDQLDGLRGKWRSDEQARPWEALRGELVQARERAQALQGQEQQLQADRARLSQLAQTRALLQTQLQAEQQARTNLAARHQVWVEALARQAQADALSTTIQPQAQAAQGRVAAARAALGWSRQEAQRIGQQQQLQEIEAGLAVARQALDRAESESKRGVALKSAVAAAAVDEATLRDLRQLDRQRRDAELRRQAVATRLQFHLPSDQTLTLRHGDGPAHTLSGQGEHLIDTAVTLSWGDGAEMTILPGGQDLTALAVAHGQAEEALRAALQRLGLAGLDEAEARAAECQSLRLQAQLAEQALALVAPQGLDALRGQVARFQDRVRTLREALANLPPRPCEDGAVHLEVLPLPQAEAELEAALQQEQRAARTLSEAQQGRAMAASLVEQAQREHAAARATLDAPERLEQHAQVQQQWLACGEEHAALAARIDEREIRWREARPDIVAQDIQRLERSIEQQLSAHQQRREQLLVLENTLQQAHALDLEEHLETARGELARARARHDELQRRANALDLLCTLIEARRQAAIERLQAPLQQRLQHYLPLLMPGASIRMTSELAPGALLRPAGATVATDAIESAEIDTLSFGAREQIGLITRFAYADLLQQAGRPTLLILDDALVHSDARRLVQMKRVLFDTAQRHQILLFTCHPEDWQDMGVPIRALAG